jgi:hypothetical protein
MKANILGTGLLLSLGLLPASAGQLDPRCEGVWVGVGTYQTRLAFPQRGTHNSFLSATRKSHRVPVLVA